MGTEHNSVHQPGGTYEKRDFNMRFVWSSAWTLLGIMFAGLFITFLMFAGYGRIWSAQDAERQPSKLAASLPVRPPEPRLQDMPAQELQQFRQQEAAALSTYGWVEPAAGVVRIPVDRAMELTLERGLSVRANLGNEENAPGKGTPATKK